MDNTILIRTATLADASIILHHRWAMFEDMHVGSSDSNQKALELFRPYLECSLATHAYRGWLAETPDGRVIGGGGLIVHEWPASPRDLQPQMRRAYILNVYVDPAFRGRGIAKQITTTIVDCCRQQGFCAVYLHASEQGLPIYKAMGFKPTPEMRLEL